VRWQWLVCFSTRRCGPPRRELSIRYDKRGRITAIDTPVGLYRYAYDDKRTAGPVKVALPGEPNMSRLYHYEDRGILTT
jgi:hypothetical protein